MAPAASSLARRDVVLLGVAVAAGVALGKVAERTVPVGRKVDDAIAAAALDAAGCPTGGPVAASVRMSVFTDYRCPACRRAFPSLEEAVRADGDVLTVYREWPILGPGSERAARVALAAAPQGVYPSVHRRLMRDDRPITDDMLRDVVTGVGGDWRRLIADLDAGDARIAGQLRDNGRRALALGLAGTPGYLAGRFIVAGAIDAGEFKRLFARARADA